MSTLQIDSESNALIHNSPRQLDAQRRHEGGSSVVRVVIALTLDVTINDQTTTPRISNIAVLSTTI